MNAKCVSLCVHVCICACVQARVRVCARVPVCVRTFVRVCVRARARLPFFQACMLAGAGAHLQANFSEKSHLQVTI